MKKLLRIIALMVIVVLLIGISIIWYFDLWQYIGVIYRVKAHPEQAYEKSEFGRYSSWAWTPDNRIIYVKNVEGLSHTKGMGPYGYNVEYNKTLIEIINPDGTGKRTVKEISYMSGSGKWQKRVNELREKYNRQSDKFAFDLEQIANQDRSDGTLDRKYPDSPLAHIGWIDWNAKNNKLVFVANDGKGKTGIAISDPEFKEVRWINYEGNNEILSNTKWSCDGNKVAFLNRGYLNVINIKDLTINKISDNSILSFDWQSNDKSLIALKTGEGLLIIDIIGNIIRKLNVSGGDPSISPDGKWVVYFDVDTKIMDINGNNKRTLYPYGGHFFPKWSPDGKKILMGWEGAVEVIDPDGNNFFVVTKGEEKK